MFVQFLVSVIKFAVWDFKVFVSLLKFIRWYLIWKVHYATLRVRSPLM